VYSAHGVAPGVRRIAAARRLRTVDATCPLVAKVHQEAARYSRAGYRIVLIGHAGHDEVTGTMGEAPHAKVLVESPEDVDRLDVGGPKVAYLTQTTLSVDDAHRVIARLKTRFPDAVGPPKEDICYATQNRQEAVRTLAREATVAVVLGSQHSSNSRRLVEVAVEAGVPAHLIDSASDLDMTWFDVGDTVLVTAGASVPESVVDECVACLRTRYDAEVERRTVRDERVSFPLPRELRRSTGGAAGGVSV
jgi:4-hydroxy-3-methylbut-2-enyl diphosphate reductase